MGRRNPREYLRVYRERGAAGLPESSDPTPAEGPIFAGRIKMVNPERGFGFLIYNDAEGVRRDIFFHFSDVIEGSPELRKKATFGLKQCRDGRIVAANVRVEMPSIQRTEGCQATIVWFNQDLGYGFLRDSENRGIFVPYAGITSNATGHRCFILEKGARVFFTLNEYLDRTEDNFFATDVRLDRDDSAIDPEATEFSQVVKWDRSTGCGVAIRSCGVCKAAFRSDAITTTGEEFLAVNDWINHTTTVSEDGACAATNVILHEPGFEPPAPEPEPEYPKGSAEAFFASIPDVQPESEPQPAPVDPEQIYDATERKLSLRELIRRKNAA